MLAELDSSGDLDIKHEIYDTYILERIEDCPEADRIYRDIQNKQKEKSSSEDEENQITKNEVIFQLFTDMLFEICSKCGSGFDLMIQIRIQKKGIKEAILEEISEIKDYICLCFWLKEEEFLKYLNCERIIIPEKIKYLYNGEKIPFIIIPKSTLELESNFFLILPSWREASKIGASSFKNHHKNLLKLPNPNRGFPPSALLQDEILDFMLSQDGKLKPKIANGFWKLLIYSIFHMIADGFEDKEKMQFNFNYEFKKEIIDLGSEEGRSLLELPENQNLRDIFTALKDFNEEYVESAKISSLKKGWKIAFNEVLGFDLHDFIDADNIHKIMDLYKKTLEKAFSDELEKLTDLITTVEKSTLDIIDQIAKTINSISSEIHNSTVAVFGGLLVEILVVLSGKEKLVWQLGILLIFQFIVFYIPMVNRKINGLINGLLDTREVYEKSIENSFKILDLPKSDIFSKVQAFRANVNDQWSRFEESVATEIRFSRKLSFGLYFLLLFLISAKPKAFDNIFDFFIKNDVAFNNLQSSISNNLGDFVIILTPVLVLIFLAIMLSWAKCTKEGFLEEFPDYSFEIGQKLLNEYSIYSSIGLFISFLILYIFFSLFQLFI